MKVIAICVLLYLVSKLLAPLIGQGLWNLLFGTKKKNNKDMDFDRMIEQKKAMLRGDGKETVAEAMSKKVSRKSRSEEVLHDEYQNLTAKGKRNAEEEKRLQELKELISWVDSLQWGSGKGFQEIASRLSKSINLRVQEVEVARAFNVLLTRETLIGPNDKIYSQDKVASIIESFILADYLLAKKELHEGLAKRWMMRPVDVLKGIGLYCQKKQNKTINIAQLVKAPSYEPPTPETPLKLSLIKEGGQPLDKNELLQKIREEAELFHTLSPLPPLKGKEDIKGAFTSLGLPEKAGLDQIKKQYKKLARLKHPDRLKSKGIPTEFESIATENFTQIKDAYDILVKKMSS